MPFILFYSGDDLKGLTLFHVMKPMLVVKVRGRVLDGRNFLKNFSIKFAIMLCFFFFFTVPFCETYYVNALAVVVTTVKPMPRSGTVNLEPMYIQQWKRPRVRLTIQTRRTMRLLTVFARLSGFELPARNARFT